GPQGSIFGQGSLLGGISYRPNMPSENFEANISMGVGNFGENIVSGIVNTPIVEQKLLLRVGSIYNNRDGYVENTFGGKLNGQNAFAGKFYLSYNPLSSTQIKLMYDFEKNNTPANSFFTGLPNAYGDSDFFSGVISAVPGKNLKFNRIIDLITLDVRHYFNNSLNIISISSYRDVLTSEFWNADGAAANALNFIEDDNYSQWYQELRLNYNSQKIKGFAGISIYNEDMQAKRTNNPNEKNLFWLFYGDKDRFINPDGTPNNQEVVPALEGIPANLIGSPLTDQREEYMYTFSKNTSLDYFADLTYSITPKLKLIGGIRLTQDFVESGYRGEDNGVPATIGFLRGSTRDYINFKVLPQQSEKGSFTSFTGRAVLQYQLNRDANLYFSYSTGRRPPVLQYSSGGDFLKLKAETARNFELGYKQQPLPNLYYDLAVFYFQYSNFRTTSQKFGEPFAGTDGGKASSYGFELSFKYNINNNLNLSANYGYNRTRYDKEDANGNKQQLAGQTFKLSPDHIFTLTSKLKTSLKKGIELYTIPSFNYKSRFALFNNVKPGDPDNFYQNGYGLFNLIAGLHFEQAKIDFSVYSNNLFNKKDYF
ncbi:MAG: TonB-dependent receptor, partial [Tenacibaculum sp.]